MIRQLKILSAAALVLTAIGVIGASAAQAAEFHCSLTECRLTPKTDGTGKNAHHVIIFENETTTESVSFTCESLRGHARIGKNTTEITLTEVSYDNCNVNGSVGATIDMTGCDLLFTANGEVHIECPPEKHIDFGAGGGCVFTIFPGRYKGATFTNVGVSPSREITLSFDHLTIPGVVADNCAPIIKATNLVATYTTGNTLLTGETETGEVMADAWFE